MKETYLQLDTLGCPSCGVKIEQAVKTVEGVEEVEVLFNASKVKVVGDADKDNIVKTVVNLGYPVLDVDGVPVEAEVKEKKKRGFFRRK